MKTAIMLMQRVTNPVHREISFCCMFACFESHGVLGFQCFFQCPEGVPEDPWAGEVNDKLLISHFIWGRRHSNLDGFEVACRVASKSNGNIVDPNYTVAKGA